MPAFEVALPAGFTLVDHVERPDLIHAANVFNGSVWPEFMLQDTDADRYWYLLDSVFAGYQLVLLDADGRIAAANNSAPLAWDGAGAGLPDYDPNVWVVHAL